MFVAPGHRHPGLDGRLVVTQSLRKALHSGERAGGRTDQPGIQAVGLVGAPKRSKVSCERDSLC